MQIMTGTTTPTRVKIIVIDLDGPGALKEWKKVCSEQNHDVKKTWVAESGGGGHHIYYRLPTLTLECPSGILWGIWDTALNNHRGGWQKHCEVRLLGDRNLVMSPPSVHPESGKGYRYLAGCGPLQYSLPAVAPSWLLSMPRLQAHRIQTDLPRSESVYFSRDELPDNQYSRAEVLDAIPDKVSLVRSWGVRFTRTQPSATGWLGCHVPGREDNNPSGSFCIQDGLLHDFAGDGRTLSLFDVGVACGVYIDWRDCLRDLGNRYLQTSKNS